MGQRITKLVKDKQAIENFVDNKVWFANLIVDRNLGKYLGSVIKTEAEGIVLKNEKFFVFVSYETAGFPVIMMSALARMGLI